MRLILYGIFLLAIVSLSSLAVLPPPPLPTSPPPFDSGDTQSGNGNEATNQSPSCSDNIKNLNETDIDCGGSCGKCGEDKNCLINGDCLSNNCQDSKCSVIAENIKESKENENIILSQPTEQNGSQNTIENEEPIDNNLNGEPIKINKFLFFSLVVFCIFLIFLNIFLFLKLKNKSNENSLGATSNDRAKLKLFIDSRIKMGYDSETIKRALLKHKWSGNLIDEVLYELNLKK